MTVTGAGACALAPPLAIGLLLLAAPSVSVADTTLPTHDPIFSGCRVKLLGCFTEGADDPRGRKVSGGDTLLRLRSLPYGTACDQCDSGLNQCDEPPSADGKWPIAPKPQPPCETAKMDLEYCAKICFEWFGRTTPSQAPLHEVVYAGAQFGEQCWCMPNVFPATGVDVPKAQNDVAGQCDTKCKADGQTICGGAWHNTVIEIDCRPSAWGWPFVGLLTLGAAGVLTVHTQP
jgi:hypothetical protein